MNGKYVVLRSFPAAPGLGMRRGGVEAKSPTRSIAISTALASELPQLRRDSTVEAIAASLPMRLIRPVSRRSTSGGSGGRNSDSHSGGAGGSDGGDGSNIAWGIRAVGAHECRFDGEGIVVAVLDTGIDVRHPAFSDVNFEQKEAAVSKEDYQRSTVQRMVTSVFDNTPALLVRRLLDTESLSSDDLAQIRALLRKKGS